MSEIWKDVLGFEGRYQVSSLSRMRSVTRKHPTGKMLNPGVDWTGLYRQVILFRDKKQLHRRVHILVCEAFHGPRPKGAWACHINGDATDNRPENLCWAPPKRNGLHSQIHNGNGEPLLHRFSVIIANGLIPTEDDLAEARQIEAAFAHSDRPDRQRIPIWRPKAQRSR